MKTIVKTPIIFQPSKIFLRVLNRINVSVSKKNIKTFPQLVIFSFDHISTSINWEGRYENETLLLLEEFIIKKMPNSKKNVSIDIGANIGNHSIFLSKFFNKVYSFEPNPIVYDVLSINSKYLAVNKNIIPYNMGLSDKSGKLPFAVFPTNIGGSRIKFLDDAEKSNDKIIYVDVESADKIETLQKEKNLLIKIDVEGHEINALKGAGKLIRSNKPIILFEAGARESDKSFEVIEYLSSLNYKFYTIKQRFYFGDSFLSKLCTNLLRLLFGQQLSFVETKNFKKKYYEMIMAINDDE